MWTEFEISKPGALGPPPSTPQNQAYPRAPIVEIVSKPAEIARFLEKIAFISAKTQNFPRTPPQNQPPRRAPLVAPISNARRLSKPPVRPGPSQKPSKPRGGAGPYALGGVQLNSSSHVCAQGSL